MQSQHFPDIERDRCVRSRVLLDLEESEDDAKSSTDAAASSTDADMSLVDGAAKSDRGAAVATSASSTDVVASVEGAAKSDHGAAAAPSVEVAAKSGCVAVQLTDTLFAVRGSRIVSLKRMPLGSGRT